MNCYQKAWPLVEELVPGKLTPSPHPTRAGQPVSDSQQAMIDWAKSPENEGGIHRPAFLAVQRLLGYPLGEHEVKTGYREQTNLLLVETTRERNGRESQSGLVKPLYQSSV